jgi:hypothetical protein
MLSSAAPDAEALVREENRSPMTKHKGFLSFRFLHCNLTIEHYRLAVAIPCPAPTAPFF